ncbi:MAG TPA: ADP-ribosylglycohydrolase family protein [Gemmatimonadales bacterium]|nr:ADP-ribosylglycohydrolase family protein [Gemmatimonadales bacterium]
MVKPVPTLIERARGAMLGHAAGNALGVPTEFLLTPERIRAAFPGGLTEIRRADRPESPWDDDAAMAVVIAEELLRPEPDPREIARRWVRWMEQDGRGIGTWTRTALQYFSRHDAPIPDARGSAGNGAVMRTIPVALRTFREPRALLSAACGIAALTHPDPRCVWSAAAITVACGQLLQGRRDFLPDVVEALRVNDAPAEVLEAVRRVPRERRGDLPITGPAAGYTVHCMEIALWTAWHEPSLEAALVWLANAGGDTDTNAAVAGGLLGARDGEGMVPRRWVEQVARAAYLAELGERLVGGGER